MTHDTADVQPDLTHEELAAEAEAHPAPDTLGSVLMEAPAAGVEEAVEAVAAAALAESDAAPEEAVEGAIPLSQVDVAAGRAINFKMIKIVDSEDEAVELCRTLPEGSFYKKNPAGVDFRVYSAV